MILCVQYRGVIVCEISRAELDKAVACGAVTDYKPDGDGNGTANVTRASCGIRLVKIVAIPSAMDSVQLAGFVANKVRSLEA